MSASALNGSSPFWDASPSRRDGSRGCVAVRLRRLLRPQRMRTAAGATKTHGSGGGFRRFLAFGRIFGRNARKRRDRPALTCVSAICAALSCVSAIRPALTYVLANRPVGSAEQAGELGTTPSPPLLRCAVSARRQAADRGRRTQGSRRESAANGDVSTAASGVPVGARPTRRREQSRCRKGNP